MSFNLFAISTTNIVVDEGEYDRHTALEALGAIIWYSTKCNNLIIEAEDEISKVIVDLGLGNEPEFNDDVSNGMNKAWFAGCERIKEKILSTKYKNYLICKKLNGEDEDGNYINNCKIEGDKEW